MNIEKAILITHGDIHEDDAMVVVLEHVRQRGVESAANSFT